MSWDPVWEQIHCSLHWGRYPPEELIRFVARNYFSAPDRWQVRILELGCGAGANLWFLAREQFEAYGIDGSKTAIANAEGYLKADCLQANLQVGDIIALDQFYPPAHFDAVIDVASLQHNKIPAVQTALGHALTCLKAGGRIFSMMVATGSYGDKCGREIEPGTFMDVIEGPNRARGLCHFFTEEEIFRLFNRFSEVQVEYSARSLDSRQHWYNHWVIEGVKRP